MLIVYQYSYPSQGITYMEFTIKWSRMFRNTFEVQYKIGHIKLADDTQRSIVADT